MRLDPCLTRSARSRSSRIRQRTAATTYRSFVIAWVRTRPWYCRTWPFVALKKIKGQNGRYSVQDEHVQASNCLICIAAGEARISAACLINLAASTSARAAMTLDSPILFCCAADDSEAETSGLKMISLMRIPSMATPHLSATSPTISAISNAMASRSVTTLWTARAPTTWRRVVCARSMSA